MRGEPRPLPIQVGQALGEPLQAPNGALLSTSQNTIGRYNQLRVRPGLTAIGNAIADPAIGQFSFIDTGGVSNLVIGTPSRWYALNNTLGVFTDLAGGSPLAGAVTQPIRFTMGLQSATKTLVGVNGPFNKYKTWVPGAAAYSEPAAAIEAVCCMSLAGRVLFGATGNASGLPANPSRVQWTAFADLTSLPALAFSDLSELENPIVAMQRLHPTSGAVLADGAQYLALAQPGSDATAFAFILVDSQPGPVGPAAVCPGPQGTAYYFGSDYNLYRFDGSSAQIVAYISWLIQAAIITISFQALATVSMVYVPQTQDILIAVPTETQGVPSTIFAYNILTQQVNIWRYATTRQISSLGLWSFQTQTTWEAMPDLPWTTSADVPWNQAGVTATGQTVVVGLGASVATMSGTTDLGTGIDWIWDYQLPLSPGKEYIFDSVEIITNALSSDTVSVSVKSGPSADNLTTTALQGSPFNVSTGSARATMELSTEKRARVMILSLSGTATQADVFRSIEAYVSLQGVAS